MCEMVAALFVLSTWCVTEQVLAAVGTRSEIAEMAGTFATYSILSLAPRLCFEALSVWSSAQRVVHPQLIANCCGFALNFATNALFVPWLGLKGSPIATAVTRTTQLILFSILLFYRDKLHVRSWPAEGIYSSIRWSRVREFLQQAVPLMIANVAEEWQLQVIAFLTSRISEPAVATHTSVMQLYLLFASVCFGLLEATMTRCAYHLGGGRVRSAKRVPFVSLTCMFLPVTVIVGAVFASLRNYVGMVFSSDHEVKVLAARIAPVMGIGFVALAPFYAGMATLQAQGRPGFIAVSYFIGCWGVCLPCVVFYSFNPWGYGLGLGLLGVWLAMCTGYFVTTVLCSWSVLKSDWERAMREAVSRNEKHA
eukprot:PhM_4_TR16167/c0_g1_i2/m.24627/K03327/TC.MATE, SLC47A, norM, mdtK, dinF; multidrug resistance protein, MATE family